MFNIGDIILTEKKSSIFIKFMKYFQKDPVKFGHAMVVIDDDKNVIESNIRIRISPIHISLKGADSYKIIRRKNLTDKEFHKLQKSLLSLEGQFYSIKRILLQMLDHFFNTNWFTKRLKNRKDQVCSSLVAWGYHVACKTKFNGVEWASCDPDDIDDEATNDSDEWIVVREVIK